MFCAKYCLQRFTETGDELKPMHCKTWDCPECQQLRRRQLIAIAIAGKPTKMLTLTVNTNVGQDPTDRRKMLHQAWTKLRKRMARKLGVPQIHYMAFVEKTEQGEPHLHILLRCGYIHFKWYRRQMRELLQSPVIWIEKIKGAKRAAFYVTKYCTKAPAQFAAMKRYWRSKDYELLTKDSNKNQYQRISFDRILRERFTEVVEYRLPLGWALKPIPDGWVSFVEPKKAIGLDGYVYRSPGSAELHITHRKRAEHVENLAGLNKGGCRE